MDPVWLILDLGDVVEGVFGEAITGIELVVLWERKVSHVVVLKSDLLNGGGFWHSGIELIGKVVRV